MLPKALRHTCASRWGIALLAVMTAEQAIAQGQSTAVIRGRVISDLGQPLVPANVQIADLNVSVATQTGGRYAISVPAERVRGQTVTMRARAVGFKPNEQLVTITVGTHTADFTLRTDVNRLEEVVITGVTGATAQRNLSFSVAKVDTSDIHVPAVNPLTQLAGKVAGAHIVSFSGRPGNQPDVMLRGPKSINGLQRGQSPLFIVDGVIINGALPDLNGEDIESIEVVKGAAASSIYGSRAGNGVIQITTKRGRASADGTQFRLRTEYGQGVIPGEFRLSKRNFLLMDESSRRFCVRPTGQLDCARTVDINEEALRINEQATGAHTLTPQTFVNDFGLGVPASKQLLRGLYQVNHWPMQHDAIAAATTNSAYATQYADITGRSGSVNYFLSASNHLQEAAFVSLDGFRRQSLRVNLDNQINDAWRVGLTSFLSKSRTGAANAEDAFGLFWLTRVPAGIDLLQRDRLGRLLVRSNPLSVGLENANPLYNFEADRQTDRGDRVIGSVTSRYVPGPWLALEANLGFDGPSKSFLRLRDRGFRTSGNFFTNLDTLGFIRQYSESQQAWNLSLNATASRNFADALVVRWTAQYLVERQNILTSDLTGRDLVVAGLTNTQTARQILSASSTDQSIGAIGVLSGVSLTFRDRYVFDALFRRDGSSLFGADARWANYGRASGSWRLTDEPWWSFPAVSEFKLRASVGTAGGRPKFDAQYETYTIASGGLTPNTLGNRNLRPELTIEAEYGVDAELLDRFGINLSYAHSSTRNQILSVPLSVASGFSTQWQNAGTLDNSTWEISLNLPIITQRNFAWSARVNFDRNRSVITALNTAPYFTCAGTPGSDCAGGTTSMFSIRVGEQMGAIYGDRFITSCNQLPDEFAAQCGPGREWQKNDEGLIVWVGAGHSLTQGITHNLWQAERFGCVDAVTGRQINANGAVACRNSGGTVNAPNGVTNAWGNAILLRDSTGTAVASAIGHTLPDYRVSMAQTITWRRLFVYALIDASVGNDVWNQHRHWSFGDFQTREQDQDGKTVETAKPLAHYWRGGAPESGTGSYGFYNVLRPNNVTVEDASYAKLREVSLGYHVGPVAGTGDWTVSVIGRNLYTASAYRGFDPEVGRAGGQLGSGALNAVGAQAYPNIRSFTVSVVSRF